MSTKAGGEADKVGAGRPTEREMRVAIRTAIPAN